MASTNIQKNKISLFVNGEYIKIKVKKNMTVEELQSIVNEELQKRLPPPIIGKAKIVQSE